MYLQINDNWLNDLNSIYENRVSSILIWFLNFCLLDGSREDNFWHALEVHHLFLLFLQYLFNVQMCLSLIKEFLAQTLSSNTPLQNNDAVKDPTAGIQG